MNVEFGGRRVPLIDGVRALPWSSFKRCVASCYNPHRDLLQVITDDLGTSGMVQDRVDMARTVWDAAMSARQHVSRRCGRLGARQAGEF